MRVSRKFWGGMIAGGIVGIALGAVAKSRMRQYWSPMGWRPDVSDFMDRASKMAKKWRH